MPDGPQRSRAFFCLSCEIRQSLLIIPLKTVKWIFPVACCWQTRQNGEVTFGASSSPTTSPATGHGRTFSQFFPFVRNLHFYKRKFMLFLLYYLSSNNFSDSSTQLSIVSSPVQISGCLIGSSVQHFALQRSKFFHNFLYAVGTLPSTIQIRHLQP